MPRVFGLRRRAAGRTRSPQPFVADKAGVAAIEFALVSSLLIIGLFNSIDLGRYLYIQMEVQNAAQMGAQNVWKTCAPPNLPATTACAGEASALTASVQSTSLGTAVTVASGYPTEGWYCVNASGALVNVGAISSPKPTDCSSVGEGSYTPGDYFAVQTTYSYAPLFAALNVAGTLPTPITSTSYMRLQ